MFPCKCDGDYCQQRQESRRIDKMLKSERRRLRREIRILLLGAGESGKSTIMKQMKIIHGENLIKDQSIEDSRHIIYKNILKGIMVLIDARRKLEIAWEDENNSSIADFVFEANTHNLITIEHFSRYVSLIETLWKDAAIQLTFQRRNEFQLSDGLHFLLKNLKRISSEKYIPTNDDLLHSRVPTRSILEYSVNIKGVYFIFIDVGGQRKQRRQWLQCMDNVTSVLFVVSSIEYDQFLVEDCTKNRLNESLEIFEQIISSPFFGGASFILFLNKTDLLIEKLKNLKLQEARLRMLSAHRAQSIEHYFSEFNGDSTDLVTVQGFLQYQFDRRKQNKELYCHFTTAVDTENMKKIFNDVRNTILIRNINDVMIQ